MMEIGTVWPNIVTGVVVAACALLVTKIVNGAVKKLDNIATKDFVTSSLVLHGTQLKSEISDMFVKASIQQVVNQDLQTRMRLMEGWMGERMRMAAGMSEENREKEK
jgi:hypothetical protein